MYERKSAYMCALLVSHNGMYVGMLPYQNNSQLALTIQILGKLVPISILLKRFTPVPIAAKLTLRCCRLQQQE
jgi:hypothetical protein